MEILAWIVAVLLILIGLTGTVLPALPGTILVFGGLLLAAWIDNFTRVGPSLIIVLGILSVLAYVLEAVATGMGTKIANASRQALIGAVLGTIAGIFTGFVGLLFFPFIGAFIGEWWARRDLMQAGRAGLATWLGMMLGIAARLALAFLMIGIFIIAFFWPH